MTVDILPPQKWYFPGLEIWLNLNFFAVEKEKTAEISEMLEQIRQDPDFYVKKNLIKNDLATTVASAKIGELNLIIKRINAKSLFTSIRRLFCITRADKNWHFSNKLQHNKIDALKVLLLVKKKYFGLCYASYVYMTKIEGLEARAYFKNCTAKSQWQPIADKIICLIKKLSELGLRHRDLNLSNMIVEKNKEKIYLLDLDAMKDSRLMRGYFEKKEAQKFIKNIGYLKQENGELFVYFFHALINNK